MTSSERFTAARGLVLSPEDKATVEEIETLARAGAEGVARLVERLSAPSWAVRRSVVSAIASVGKPAIPALVEVLKSKRDDEARIAAAVDALASSRANVDDEMMDLARSAEPPVVCDALQVLGRRRTHPAVGLLAELSRAEDDNVAVASIEALGRIGGTETVEPLVVAAEAKHFFRTFPAIDALGRTGDRRAVAPLTSLLADPLYALEAVRGLGHTGDENAIAPLAKLILKGNVSLVRTVAGALAELRERYEARYGDTPEITRALPAAVSASEASERIVTAIPGVGPSELVAIARVLGWLGDPIGIEQLIALAMHDPPAGTAAADALRRLGPRAIPQLLDQIVAGDSGRRLRLLPIVGYTFERVQPIVACLTDPDPEVRVRACEALARAGNTAAVPPLFALIGDSDTRVSQAAAAAIQSLGSIDAKRLALEQAKSSDLRVRRAALRIISYFGYPEGLEMLIEAAAHDDEKLRDAAINGLALIDSPRGVEALLAAKNHAHARTRGAVMRALGQTTATPPVVASLLEALGDEDAWVRYYACQALGRLRVQEAVDAVIARMSDDSGQVRIAAVEALAGLPSPRAAAALEEATRSSDIDLRRAALVGLGVGRNPSAIPTLRAAASSDDASIRLVAIGALAEFDSDEVVPALAHAATDPDENIRSAAIGYLSTRPGAATTKVLVERLIDRATRDRAFEAITVAADDHVEGLLVALETSDADTAPVFIAALARMRRPSSQAAIAAALDLENVHARRAAASALVAIGTDEARDALERAASDPDPVVRRVFASVQRT